MTVVPILNVYHTSERCRVTEDGPEVIREYRMGTNMAGSDSYTFLMGPYSAAGYPALGEQYAPDVEIFVSEVSAQRTGSDRETDHNDNETPLAVWKVTVKWTPITGLENKWPEGEDIYDVSVFGEEVDLDGRYDWAGQANVNTAGEFYEDKLPIKAPVTVVRLTAKELSPPDMTLHKAVNDAAWWNGAAGFWLCRNVSGEFVHAENALYWKNTYEFAYNPLSWTLWKASSGYYHRGQVSGVESGSRMRNINDDGSENIRPCLLDANGAELPEGSSPYYQGFQIYHAYAFPNFPPMLSALDLSHWPSFPFIG